MLAGWYEQSGPAKQVIQIGQMDQPQAGPGEVLVRLHASGINPSDYKKRGNSNTKLEFPRIVPHSDGAGRIAVLPQDDLSAPVRGHHKGEQPAARARGLRITSERDHRAVGGRVDVLRGDGGHGQ